MTGAGRLARLGVAAGLAVGVVTAGLVGSGPASASRGDSLADIRNNVSITDATTHQRGHLDSAGSSFRASAMAAAGYGPGADVQVDGVDFTMPDVAPGSPTTSPRARRKRRSACPAPVTRSPSSAPRVASPAST